MNRSTYKNISEVGSNGYNPVNNPLTYCLNNDLGQRFMHGGQADIMGPNSRQCNLFMSEYCSKKWDSFCDNAYKFSDSYFPNSIDSWANSIAPKNLTAAEGLIYNTASRKYLIQMIGCFKKLAPFDPNVATSPMISYWTDGDSNTNCVPVYAVNPSEIDNDYVMNKILDKPSIAPDILINIYNTMKRQNTLFQLDNTRIGKFFKSYPMVFKQ